MRIATVPVRSPYRSAPVLVLRKPFRLSAHMRFWLHFVASGLSCVLFFGGIVALLWGAA